MVMIKFETVCFIWGTRRGRRRSRALSLCCTFNIAQPESRTSIYETNAWCSLRMKKGRVKKAVEWRVNIMTAGLIYDVTWKAVTIIITSNNLLCVMLCIVPS